MEEEEHVFSMCRYARSMYEWYCRAKKEIRYAKYAACWGCGCPQWICEEHLPGGGRERWYKEIDYIGWGGSRVVLEWM
jgi:hypothetical protein